jgi:hypothetical protein
MELPCCVSFSFLLIEILSKFNKNIAKLFNFTLENKIKYQFLKFSKIINTAPMSRGSLVLRIGGSTSEAALLQPWQQNYTCLVKNLAGYAGHSLPGEEPSRISCP